MEINDKILKPITEIKYLQAENVQRYRPILRYMYEQHESVKYILYKEEIYEAVKSLGYNENYTIEQCEMDLKSLVEWGNLIAMQDISNVETIEEFKNRKYIYQLSQYSVEIERLVIKLENLLVEGSSLEPTLFERLRIAIDKIDDINTMSLSQIGVWWNDLNSDFKRLNYNYQDYIKTFYGIRAEEFLKSSQFIAYKSELVQYLRDFIKELQKNSAKIEQKLLSVSSNKEEEFLDKIYAYEKSIPRIDYEPTEEELRERNKNKWQNFKNWFIGTEKSDSEALKLLDVTDEIIRKITRYASQIAENRGNSFNRKEEYKKLVELFSKCKDSQEAHKLSSLVFGIFNTKHLKSDFDRETDNINSSVYSEKNDIVETTPRSRAYREKIVKTSIPDRSEEKQKLKEEYFLNLQKEKEMLEKIIVDQKIIFSNLGKIDSKTRRTLLIWIARANATEEKVAKTDDGNTYKLEILDKQENVILESDDGEFVMPSYQITFTR